MEDRVKALGMDYSTVTVFSLLLVVSSLLPVVVDVSAE